MINVSIARRYARALLAVSLESGRADEILAELENMASLLAHSLEARDFFQSPSFTREQRHRFLAKLSKTKSLSEPTISFLKLLVDRGRMEHIEHITRIYRDLADEAAGRARAEVSSPSRLEPAAAKALAGALSRITSKKIQLEENVDENLIGGLVVKVGDRVFDGSLKTQLERVRQTALS